MSTAFQQVLSQFGQSFENLSVEDFLKTGHIEINGKVFAFVENQNKDQKPEMSLMLDLGAVPLNGALNLLQELLAINTLLHMADAGGFSVLQNGHLGYHSAWFEIKIETLAQQLDFVFKKMIPDFEKALFNSQKRR